MKFASWLAAAIIAPFVVMSVELLLTRHFNFKATEWDWVGVALSVFAGLCCLWKLPISKGNRALFSVIFMPLGVAILFIYTLLFVSMVFGDSP